MIKLFPMPDNTAKLWPIFPLETPDTINNRLMIQEGKNFKTELQDAITGRVIPRDEELIDGREYHIVYATLPWE